MAVCLLAMSLCACQRHSCRGWRRHSAAGLWLLIQRWCLRSLWPRSVIVTSQYLSILIEACEFQCKLLLHHCQPMHHAALAVAVSDTWQTVDIPASCTGSVLNPEGVLRTFMMTSHVAFFCIHTNIQNTKASEWVSEWVSEFVTVTLHPYGPLHILYIFWIGVITEVHR